MKIAVFCFVIRRGQKKPQDRRTKAGRREDQGTLGSGKRMRGIRFGTVLLT